MPAHKVLTGDELATLSDVELETALAADSMILSRVSPHD